MNSDLTDKRVNDILAVYSQDGHHQFLPSLDRQWNTPTLRGGGLFLHFFKSGLDCDCFNRKKMAEMVLTEFQSSVIRTCKFYLGS